MPSRLPRRSASARPPLWREPGSWRVDSVATVQVVVGARGLEAEIISEPATAQATDRWCRSHLTTSRLCWAIAKPSRRGPPNRSRGERRGAGGHPGSTGSLVARRRRQMRPSPSPGSNPSRAVRPPAAGRLLPGPPLSGLHRASDLEPSEILEDSDETRMVEVAATSHPGGLHELLHLRRQGEHDAVLAPGLECVL